MSFDSYIRNAVREDRAYNEMLQAARQRLFGRDALDVAARTGMDYDPASGRLSCSSLGRSITVNSADWSVHGAAGNWHCLTILHYLEAGDGVLPENRLITFGQLPDGLARGGDFDRRCEGVLGRALGRMDAEQVKSRCLRLGGRLTASNADICAVFDYMPRYPVTLKLWFADEELEGSARLFLDGSCSHYLGVEDAVTVGTLLIELLTGD